MSGGRKELNKDAGCRNEDDQKNKDNVLIYHQSRTPLLICLHIVPNSFDRLFSGLLTANCQLFYITPFCDVIIWQGIRCNRESKRGDAQGGSWYDSFESIAKEEC